VSSLDARVAELERLEAALAAINAEPDALGDSDGTWPSPDQRGRETAARWSRDVAALNLLPDLLAERRRLREALENLVDKLEECKPHIDGAFRFAGLHGQKYDGPNYGTEFSAAATVLGWISCESCGRLTDPDEIVKYRPANWDGTDDDVACYQCQTCTENVNR